MHDVSDFEIQIEDKIWKLSLGWKKCILTLLGKLKWRDKQVKTKRQVGSEGQRENEKLGGGKQKDIQVAKAKGLYSVIKDPIIKLFGSLFFKTELSLLSG